MQMSTCTVRRTTVRCQYFLCKLTGTYQFCADLSSQPANPVYPDDDVSMDIICDDDPTDKYDSGSLFSLQFHDLDSRVELAVDAQTRYQRATQAAMKNDPDGAHRRMSFTSHILVLLMST